jgi:hypothetical protein
VCTLTLPLHAHSEGAALMAAVLRDKALLPPGLGTLRPRNSWRACDEQAAARIMPMAARAVLCRRKVRLCPTLSFSLSASMICYKDKEADVKEAL